MTSCGCWISDAELAETTYTAFTSKKNQHVTARLIVRRVRDKGRRPHRARASCSPPGATMPCFTDSPFELVQAEGQHRDHAIVEQVFADWYDGPLAHLPSGDFSANAAWLVIAAMAQNLVRAAGTLAGPLHARARAATIRRDLIAVAARTARHGSGHLTLHLPERLAPRAGMAEPLARLRPAADRGLTSPDPVRTRTPERASPTPVPAPDDPGQAAEPSAAGRTRPPSPHRRERPQEISRWIEA